MPEVARSVHLRLGTHRVRRRLRGDSEGEHGPLFLPDFLQVVGRLLQSAVETCRRIRNPGCPGSIVVLNFVSLVVGIARLRDGTAGELMRAVNVISNVNDSVRVEEGTSADSWGRQSARASRGESSRAEPSKLETLKL